MPPGARALIFSYLHPLDALLDTILLIQLNLVVDSETTFRSYLWEHLDAQLGTLLEQVLVAIQHAIDVCLF